MTLSISVVSGWIGVALVVIAAAMPTVARLRLGRRAAPDSQVIRGHVLAGLATSAAAFLHALTILPSLGTAEAVNGGLLALGAGAVAFFVLFAHVGVGLQLRNPALRGRVKKRRTHVATAVIIAVFVAAHVVLLRRG